LFKDLGKFTKDGHLKEMCSVTSEILIKVSLCTINIISLVFL